MDDAKSSDGLFYSVLLDPQETKLHRIPDKISAGDSGYRKGDAFDRMGEGEAFRIPPAHVVETAFRHRGWMPDRTRVRKAMAQAGIPVARLERFDACGSDCVVEVAEDGSGYRLRANYCHDRWCVPCNRARARELTGELLRMIDGKPVAFTTLTQRDYGETLPVLLKRINESFAGLRRTKLWTEKVTGGAACIQITRGKRKDHWHVHVHILHDGGAFDWNDLSTEWENQTGNSWVVDSQDVQDVAERAAYVARYASKGCDRDVVLDPDALIEAIVALRGRRMLSTFGSWRKLGDEGQDEDQRAFRRLGRFVEIVHAARSNEAWAIGVLTALKVRLDRHAAQVKFEDVKYDREDEGKT